jgi:hypothetical protein
MRISNGYPDPQIGCTMFPDDAALEDFGFGFDAGGKKVPRAASGIDDPPSIIDIDSGLDAPEPPPLDPNDPNHIFKVSPGL